MSARTPGRRSGEALAIARDAWWRSVGAVRRTPGLLLLSFLLGVSLWVFVTDTENPTRVDLFPSPIPVQAVNVGDALAVANQLPPVDIRVAAPEDRWAELTVENFRATVDLQGLDARAQEVRVQVDVEGIGGVRVAEVVPRTVNVNLEDFVTKQVPVVARVAGTLPIGYELDDVIPATQTVNVSGPETLVELVREAVAEFNVTGLTVGVEQTLNLVPQGAGGGDIRGVRLDPIVARVEVRIAQATLPRAMPLRVQVTGEPAPGYRVTSVVASPATVQVQGTIDALQQVDALALPSVDISGARSDVARVVRVPAPDGLTLTQDTATTVFVSIAPTQGSTRMQVTPRVSNVEGGLIARIEQPSIEVVVEGPLPVLNTMPLTDLQATVDLEGLAIGTYEREVQVTAPEGIRVTAVQPATVTVTLSQE
ncbi:MAG: hypothetical protein GEU80_12400 [Dehalococcoidia bacterium]|nr:hypothetical protein [Dehalococcoidia bacterium]